MPSTSRSVRVVLVGTDLTKQSERAVQLAAEIAKASHGELVVAHAVELPPRLRGWSPKTRASDRELYRRLLEGESARAEAMLSRLVQQTVHRAGARSIARVGDAADVLIEVADEVGADLIVVARGRGGRLGRTSERLARLAGRAVLIAPVTLPLVAFAFEPGRRQRRAKKDRPRAARGR